MSSGYFLMRRGHGGRACICFRRARASFRSARFFCHVACTNVYFLVARVGQGVVTVHLSWN